MKTSKRSKKTPAVDYRASWSPVIAAANARLERETILRETAFGTVKVESFFWSEVTGIMFSTGRDFSERSFCADLGWVETLAGMQMVRVYA